MTPRIGMAGLIMALLAAVGCEREYVAPPAQPQLEPAISIRSASPVPETLLRAGDTVEVELIIAYTMAAPSGYVGLVVQDAEGETVFEQVEPLPQGRGEHRLAAVLVVPQTDALHVIVPLSGRGDRSTSAVDLLSYPVEAAGSR